MKTFLEQSKSLALLIVEKAKIRRGLLLGVATLFVFQLYFVRELLAAELLFGLVFRGSTRPCGCGVSGRLTGRARLGLRRSWSSSDWGFGPPWLQRDSKKSAENNSVKHARSLLSNRVLTCPF